MNDTETEPASPAVVYICRTPSVRTARFCSTEGRVRPMSGTFGIWYGAYLTCLGCGDQYADETGRERLPRPFARGWKQRQIAHARAAWRNAAPLRQEIERQMREEFADHDAPTGGAA